MRCHNPWVNSSEFKKWYTTTSKRVMADILTQYASMFGGGEFIGEDETNESSEIVKRLQSEEKLCREQGVV